MMIIWLYVCLCVFQLCQCVCQMSILFAPVGPIKDIILFAPIGPIKDIICLSFGVVANERCLLCQSSHAECLPRGQTLRGGIFLGGGVEIEGTHTEKCFRNLFKSNRNRIVFTMHWLIWYQTDVLLVPNQSEDVK